MRCLAEDPLLFERLVSVLPFCKMNMPVTSSSLLMSIKSTRHLFSSTPFTKISRSPLRNIPVQETSYSPVRAKNKNVILFFLVSPCMVDIFFVLLQTNLIFGELSLLIRNFVCLVSRPYPRAALEPSVFGIRHVNSYLSGTPYHFLCARILEDGT